MRLLKISEPVWAPETEAGAAPPAETSSSTPTPDTTSTPPPTSSPSEAPAASDSDFILDAFDAMQVEDLDMGTDTDVQTSVREAPQVASPPEGVAQPPPAQTLETPAQTGIATPPVQAAAPQTAPQPGTTSPAAPQAAVAPELILEKLHEEVAKHQEVFAQKLADTVYKLPDKELEKFNEDPSGVIAKVAARVHTNVVSSLTRVLSQQMPAYVHGLLQANERAQRNENEFWQANPFLDKAQHEPVVTQIAVMYKQMNPQASREQFIKTVGAMAMGALGITAQAVAQRANASPPQPAIQTPGRVVRTVPAAYAPAGAHSAPPGAHPAPQLNEWEKMTMLIDRSDQGGFDT